MAGDQVPVILLFEDVGSVKLAPEQIGATWVKVGVVVAPLDPTTTVCVIGGVHAPASSTVTVYVPGTNPVAVAVD